MNEIMFKIAGTGLMIEFLLGFAWLLTERNWLRNVFLGWCALLACFMLVGVWTA